MAELDLEAISQRVALARDVSWCDLHPMLGRMVRTDVPALVARVRDMEAEVRRYRAVADAARALYDYPRLPADCLPQYEEWTRWMREVGDRERALRDALAALDACERGMGDG